MLHFLLKNLKPDGHVVTSPYLCKLPNGEVVHSFYFRIIKLWEVPTEVLKQAGLEGMLPLLTLTKDGARHEVVEEMITGLKVAGKQDLLPLGYAFTALVFDNEADRDWLKRRFAMLKDVLEESWAYQEMKQQGLAEICNVSTFILHLSAKEPTTPCPTLIPHPQQPHQGRLDHALCVRHVGHTSHAKAGNKKLPCACS